MKLGENFDRLDNRWRQYYQSQDFSNNQLKTFELAYIANKRGLNGTLVPQPRRRLEFMRGVMVSVYEYFDIAEIFFGVNFNDVRIYAPTEINLIKPSSLNFHQTNHNKYTLKEHLSKIYCNKQRLSLQHFYSTYNYNDVFLNDINGVSYNELVGLSDFEENDPPISSIIEQE